MAVKEKGRPAGGDPIPNDVRKNKLEFKLQPRDLQIARPAAWPEPLRMCASRTRRGCLPARSRSRGLQNGLIEASGSGWRFRAAKPSAVR